MMMSSLGVNILEEKCYETSSQKIEKIYQRLKNQSLRGGNLLYITQMKKYWMIQMKRSPFYI